jgi:hypothetical protein
MAMVRLKDMVEMRTTVKFRFDWDCSIPLRTTAIRTASPNTRTGRAWVALLFAQSRLHRPVSTLSTCCVVRTAKTDHWQSQLSLRRQHIVLQRPQLPLPKTSSTILRLRDAVVYCTLPRSRLASRVVHSRPNQAHPLPSEMRQTQDILLDLESGGGTSGLSPLLLANAEARTPSTTTAHHLPNMLDMVPRFQHLPPNAYHPASKSNSPAQSTTALH